MTWDESAFPAVDAPWLWAAKDYERVYVSSDTWVPYPATTAWEWAGLSVTPSVPAWAWIVLAGAAGVLAGVGLAWWLA